MIQYEILKNEKQIQVYGYDQNFSEEDMEDLWISHNILYLDGIIAVWVENRENMNPLIHLMHEDDGCLYWRKEKDTCFDSCWIDNYIKTLDALKNKLNEN